MPNRTDPNTELTPEAREVLRGIEEETEKLRELDLADTPPATVFEAD
jgi:hypothetical protein